MRKVKRTNNYISLRFRVDGLPMTQIIRGEKNMPMIAIHPIQADIIFKALHYVCKHEGIELNAELEEVFTVLAEMNPNDTNSSDCLDVMNNLKDFIKTHETYEEYFNNEGNEEE